jgi:hypothetical protein
MGRKALPDGQARDRTIGIAASAEEREQWHHEAAARGMKLAAMARLALIEYLQNHPVRKSRRA